MVGGVCGRGLWERGGGWRVLRGNRGGDRGGEGRASGEGRDGRVRSGILKGRGVEERKG